MTTIKAQRFLRLIGALTLVALLMNGPALAQGPSPQASLGTAFTYQGRLSDTSGPVDGTCNLTFHLYDEAGSGEPPTGGTLLGTETENGVQVSDGYFSVELDFGAGAFDGDARYLEIAVDCGGGATTLSPRQPLTAAPYALYATGAPWNGLSGVPGDIADGDDDTTYSTGTGLTLSAGQFSLQTTYRLPQGCSNGQLAEWNGSAWTCTDDGEGVTAVNAGDGLSRVVSGSEVTLTVQFGGTGSAVTAAHSDHDHSGFYAPDSHDHWGETWSGTGVGLDLSGNNSSGATLDVSNSGAGSGDSAIRGVAQGGSGYSFSSYAAVWGDSDGGSGVSGLNNTGYGVSGYSNSGTGVYGYSLSGYGVYGNSDSSYGIYADGAAGDLRLSGTGTIYANGTTASDMELHSNDYIDLHLDDNGGSASSFRILNDANSVVFAIDEAGNMSGGIHDHSGVYAPDGHDHWGETWSGTGVGLTITGTNSGAVLSVNNSQTGGLNVTSYGGNTIYATNESGNGVYGSSLSGYGVVGTSGGYGVRAVGPAGDVRLGNGTIVANETASHDMWLLSNDYVNVHLDEDNNSTSGFRIYNGTNAVVFAVDENGVVDFTSWQTRTGYASVSAAAFRPQVDGYDFYNLGRYLQNVDSSSDNYVASVQLPHGATVTRMTFYWGDSSTSTGWCYLYRTDFTDGTVDVMATVGTAGSSGYGSSDDDTIQYASIDNSGYAYFLTWTLPDNNVVGYGVVIEYTYTEPH